MGICSSLLATEVKTVPAQTAPKSIGFRTIILEFTVDDSTKPMEVGIVFSEEENLNEWARFLVLHGDVKEGVAGVTKIGKSKFRAEITFPIEYDEGPLPKEVTLPKVRLSRLPSIPRKIWEREIAGGVLLKLTIDKKARLAKTEVIRASHQDFVQPAIEAVKQWGFAQPAKKNGEAIDISLFQLITFETEGKQKASWQWQVSPEPAFPRFLVTTSHK